MSYRLTVPATSLETGDRIHNHGRVDVVVWASTNPGSRHVTVCRETPRGTRLTLRHTAGEIFQIERNPTTPGDTE